MRHRGIKAALAATAVLTGTGTALSQDAAGALRFLFGVSTDLRAHDNLDLDPVSAGSTVRSDTTLTFGVQSETRRQKLNLSFGGVLRAEDAPGTGFTTGFENPNVGLSYIRDGANARLSFDASFARTDVDGSSFLDPGTQRVKTDGIDLISDTGSLDTLRAGVTLEIGKDAPLGFVLDLNRVDTSYSDTTDPGLFARTTDSASATAVLRFSPVTEGRITAGITQYSAQDAPLTTRDTQRLSFGVTHELSETTVIEASIGGRQIDDSVTGVTRSGEASFSVTHDLPRGSVGLSLDTGLTTAGQRNTVELQRRFEFPTGALEFSLGATDAEGIDPQPIGSLSYSRDLPRGAITATVSRSISVNSDANVQRRTGATLGLSHMVNEQYSIAFNLDYTDFSDAGGGGVTDRQRGSFSASYTRALTQDWNLTAGIERRYLAEAGSADAWDNAVFLTLGRDFSLLR